MRDYTDLVKRLNEFSAEHEMHGGITAEAADAIEKLCGKTDADNDALLPVSIEDVTGVLGEWLDKDMSNIPNDAASYIVEAYKICVKEL